MWVTFLEQDHLLPYKPAPISVPNVWWDVQAHDVQVFKCLFVNLIVSGGNTAGLLSISRLLNHLLLYDSLTHRGLKHTNNSQRQTLLILTEYSELIRQRKCAYKDFKSFQFSIRLVKNWTSTLREGWMIRYGSLSHVLFCPVQRYNVSDKTYKRGAFTSNSSWISFFVKHQT